MAVGINRQWPIPACSLTLADLRRLFEMLRSKALEATTEQLAHLSAQMNIQVASVHDEARNLMALTVRVQSARGDWRFANSADPLSDDSFPPLASIVVYECGPLYRQRFNQFPQNQFSVTIDFTRTAIGDLSNPALATGPGPSAVYVSGVNPTWVNAVDHELRTFFEERATRRGWLHSRFVYDLLLFFIGVPICLDGIYNLDKRLSVLVKFPAAVSVALYVYLMLVGLLGFRILFNYARWVFPKIEGPPQKSGSAVHKTILVAIFVGLMVRVVSTILWLAGIHLH